MGLDKMWSIVHSVALLTWAALLVSGAEEAGKKREERLFYVTTTSSTSTLSTATFCYQSTNAALATCGKRRRRSNVLESYSPTAEEIKPHRIGEDFDIESSIKDQTPSREGKFLVYWLTTTSTSTAYTATSTIASLGCTPSGFPLSACGKK